MSTRNQLSQYLDKVSKELDSCMKFWLTFSHDNVHGGFFTCLSEKGDVYDDTKYGWLQGRQVWTYAKLYNEVERFKRPDVLQAAVKGAEFLMKHIKDPKTSRCFFSTTRDGRPIKMQRTIFTECFYVLGLSELSRATGNAVYKKEAIDMMNLIIHWVRVNDSALGRPKMAGNTPSNTMAVPVMMMNLMDQMETMDDKLKKEYEELHEWCNGQLLAHIQRNRTCILENVSTDGKELPGCQGRLVITGHNIEAGWFLLQYAIKYNIKELQDTAIQKFMTHSFNRGWDQANGGIYYMLDVDGHCPVQLEWNMKLWWPHNEALIAFLMAFKHTGKEEHWKTFSKIFEYSWKHFSDSRHGEWYGYLNTKGEISSSFKGGPFKGKLQVDFVVYRNRTI